MEIQSNSIEIPTFLPRNFNTSSASPKKLVSSFIGLVRPLDSPRSPPWMVLCAEPSKGVTKFFRPFSRTPLKKSFDLTNFRTTILSTECHIVDEEQGFGLFRSDPSFYVKALMLPSVGDSVENCRLFAISDDGRVYESRPFDTRHFYFQKVLGRRYYRIDDIINYKGNVYALDKKEALFVRRKRDGFCAECNAEFHFCEQVVSMDNDSDDNGSTTRRKRLVVSPSGETLYMVDPRSRRGNQPCLAMELYLKVYELDSASRSWVRVSSFEDGDVEQVMFVTRDYCFFVAASEFPGCQLKNCIVFSNDAFPRYEDGCWNYPPEDSYANVAVFSLNADRFYSVSFDTYPGFPVMLWCPPPWILDNESSPSQSKSQSEAEKDGTAQPVSSDSKQDDVVSTVGQSDFLAYLTQSSVNGVVTLKKFQGIHVLPDHLPVLENVWMKHGDILGGIAICSSGLKSMALTSLATIILILEATNNGKILTKDQAQYLDSTFKDLRYMHLKVGWLAPSIKNALSTHKREQLMELGNANAIDAKAEDAEWDWLIILTSTAFGYLCFLLLSLLLV